MTQFLLNTASGGFMNSQFVNVTLALAEGLLENLTLFFVTLIFALPLGLVITFGSMSKFAPLKYLTRTFVWIIRGTPLLLQLFVVFYVPGLVFNFNGLDRMESAAVAFIINYAAYFSEIYRGGIESIPKGQYEACHVLGMSKSQTFFRVILMQVVKRVVPPMSNEIMTLVKDTSLARVIAIAEIIMVAERFTRQGIIWPLFYTGVYFLIMCGILTLLFGYIEKKLNYYKG